MPVKPLNLRTSLGCLAIVAACIWSFPGQAAAGEPAGASTPERGERLKKCLVESAVVRYYVDWEPGSGTAVGGDAVAEAAKELGDDPAAAYLTGFVKPDRTRQVAERCAAVTAGLKTSQVSLSLAALMWRDLAEVCLDGKPAAERTPEEQKLLLGTMAALEARAAEWQQGTFKERLGSFLYSEIDPPVMVRRRMPPMPAHKSIQGALGVKRWGRHLDQVTDEYIAAHPFGESLQIDAACDPAAGLVLVRSGKEAPAEAAFKLGVFDLLRTPEPAGEKAAGQALALADHDLKVVAKLPPGCLLTYADVLRLACEQNSEEFDKRVAARWSWPLSLPAWHTALSEGAPAPAAEVEARIAALVADLGSPEWPKRDAASRELQKLGAPALPALKKAAESPDAEVKARAADLVEEIQKPADDRLRDAKIRLVSLWLF